MRGNYKTQKWCPPFRSLSLTPPSYLLRPEIHPLLTRLAIISHGAGIEALRIEETKESGAVLALC